MAAAVIAPAPDALLEAYEVSSAVNRTANDSPMLLEPLREPETEEAPRAEAREERKEGQRAGELVLTSTVIPAERSESRDPYSEQRVGGHGSRVSPRLKARVARDDSRSYGVIAVHRATSRK